MGETKHADMNQRAGGLPFRSERLKRTIRPRLTSFVGSIIAGKFARECYDFFMQAAGFVLVGGRSSRMGRDKALLPLDSGLLLEEIAAKVTVAAGHVMLIGDPERYRDLSVECLPDLRSGMGPLAGIESALASRRGEWNLIVACDMPSLEEEWLCRLLMMARQTGETCIAAKDPSGAVHPLCAVYRSTCLPIVRRALDQGRLKLMDLLQDLSASTFEVNSTVWNINTPRQWAAWQEAHCQ